MPLIVGENTYVGIPEADAYFSSSLNDSGWQAATNDRREKALLAATYMLDRAGFSGKLARYDQPLSWPRIRMRDREGRSIPSDVVPQAVRDATCELASHLLSEPETKPASAIARKRVGDLEIAYRATLPDAVLPIVRQLLGPFLAGSPHSVENVW